MTNLEMLKASAALNYPIDDSTYSANLVKNGLVPSEDFNKDVDSRSLELSISDLALTLIFSAKTVSDDGYSVSLQDIADLWTLRAFYRKKWGLPDDTPDKTPKLYNATNKW